MKIQRYGTLLILLSFPLALHSSQQNSGRPYTVEQVLGFPSPENLVASPTGSTIAWTSTSGAFATSTSPRAPGLRSAQNHRVHTGRRAGTHATGLLEGRQDDRLRARRRPRRPCRRCGAESRGQSHPTQGSSVVRRRGRWRTEADRRRRQPGHCARQHRVAFPRDRKIWIAPIDGSKPAEQAFYARGTSDSPTWSPDGKTLAFVSDRTDHSFIGLFTPGQAIRFIAPSTSRDSQPAWSPDGQRIAFLRQPGVGGTPQSPLAQPHRNLGNPCRRCQRGAAILRCFRQSPAAANRWIGSFKTPAASRCAGPATLSYSCPIATAFLTCIPSIARAPASRRSC